MPEDQNKTYLGDGLYAEFQVFGVRVYASNGIEETNEIYLEGSILKALVEFFERKGLGMS